MVGDEIVGSEKRLQSMKANDLDDVFDAGEDISQVNELTNNVPQFPAKAANQPHLELSMLSSEFAEFACGRLGYPTTPLSRI